MLAAVVARGTARKAGVPGYAIAAKTETAAQCNQTEPTEDEEGSISTRQQAISLHQPRSLSMIVIIDEPTDQFASETAAPSFGNLARSLRHYKIAPASDLCIRHTKTKPIT